MSKLRFTVKFISPLAIGGFNNRLDKIGLRGSSLRGVLRFWFRAVVGPLVDMDLERLRKAEDILFGNTEEPTFRLRIIEKALGNSVNAVFLTNQCRFGPSSKESRLACIYEVLFQNRAMLDDDLILPLSATVWLWGNLGAIGNRARRGFGSPVICDWNVSDNELQPRESFDNCDILKTFLRQGMEKVKDTYRAWLTANAIPTKVLNYSDPPPGPYDPNNSFFHLQSFKQIYIGSPLSPSDFQDQNGPTGKIILECHNYKSKAQGYSNRLASPLFIRLHQINDSLHPLITWSKVDLPDNIRVLKIIQALGGKQII